MRHEAAAPVAVVTAIREEFEAVVHAARDVRLESPGRARGRIGSAEVVIARTGDGPRNASSGAGELCDAIRPRLLVGAGVAGGLTPGLSPLAVLASTRVIENEAEAPRPDPALVLRAERAGARPAAFVTVPSPVASAAGRRALASRLAAGEAGAVDMESAAWARAAAGRGVPYVVLRAISDTAEEDLPDFLPECLARDGGISRRAVALRALARPSSWPALLRMRGRVDDCGRALAAALEQFLAGAT